MELVIASHLFVYCAVCILFIDNEMADKVQQSPFIADTLDQYLELRKGRGGEIVTGDSPPSHEPFVICRDGADPGSKSVRYYQHFIVGKKRGYLMLVGRELAEGGP